MSLKNQGPQSSKPPFHLLLFYADSPGTPFPTQPSEHTAFNVPVKTKAAIDLTAKPFSDASDIWMHPTDYEPCQQLEEAARAEDIQLIRYASVRDSEHKPNAAILTCEAFAVPAPITKPDLAPMVQQSRGSCDL